MSKRFLVTGCAGFLGAAVSRALIDAGHQVLGLDHLNSDYDPLIKRLRLASLADSPDFRCVTDDLTRWNQLEDRFARETRERPFDGVLHLAGRAGHASARPSAAFKVTTAGTLRLLELCRKFQVPRFLAASGDAPGAAAGAAEASAEGFCYAHAHLHGIHAAALKFSTVYGPAGRPDQDVFRYVRWLSEEEPAPVADPASPARDYLYIDDAVRAVLAALELPGGRIWQVASGQRSSMAEVIEILSILVGRAARLVPEEKPAPRLLAEDEAQAPRIPGWRPLTPLARGLCATLEWYETCRDVARLVDLGIEGRKRSRRTAARYRQAQRREAA